MEPVLRRSSSARPCRCRSTTTSRAAARSRSRSLGCPRPIPRRRIGSLFLNPGGPGGSGVDFLVGVGAILYTDEVRARFDLVGFDPRGIIRSTPLRCFDSRGAMGAVLHARSPFPLTREEERELDRGRPLPDCARATAGGGAIIDHMSTAERGARPRRAARGGRRQQAHLLPASRTAPTSASPTPTCSPAASARSSIDGVLDPIAWSTGRGVEARLGTVLDPAAQRRGRAGDARRVLPALRRGRRRVRVLRRRRRALRCARGDACASEPVEIDLPGRHDRAARLLEPDRDHARRAVRLARRGGTSPSSWPTSRPRSQPEAHGQRLRVRLSGRGRDRPYVPTRGVRHAFPEEPDYPNFVEGFPGVACSDSDNPDAYAAWSIAGAAADARFGYFGRIWTWASSICAEWRGRRPRPLHGPVQPRDRQPGARRRQPRSIPPRRYEGAQIVDRPAAALGAADRARLGPHLAVPVAVRRRGHRALPDPHRHPAARARRANQDEVPFSGERAEELADVAREQLGLLGGREVAAARHRRPADDVEEPLGPLARRRALGDQLVGEQRDRGRDRR